MDEATDEETSLPIVLLGLQSLTPSVSFEPDSSLQLEVGDHGLRDGDLHSMRHREDCIIIRYLRNHVVHARKVPQITRLCMPQIKCNLVIKIASKGLGNH